MENIILTNNKDLRLVSVKVGVLSTLRFELPLVSASATHVEVIVTSGNLPSAYTATFIDATKSWQCDIAASQFPTVGRQSYEVAYVLDGKQFWDGKGWIEIEDATTSGIEPQPRPEPYRYAVVSVNGYGADAQGAVRIPKTFIATDSPTTTEGFMEGDIYFNRETGATWTLCNVQGTLTWVFNYKNYYTKAETDEAIDRVAAYYITYDAAGNPFPTYAALANATTVYSGGRVRVPTRNDYCVVLADETHQGAEYRYIYAVAEGQTTGSWQPQFPVEGVMTVDPTVTKNSINPVAGGGVWSAIWGALSALPTGFTSLYDWCVAQFTGKFAQYYPDGSVKSTTEFTQGIKYNAPDTVNRTITVKPFCNTGTAENDNSNLEGRVVIPPFVDAQGNGYISDDGTRFKVVGVSGGNVIGVNYNLTDVIAPTTVTTLRFSAFAKCADLTSVSLPAAESIWNGAFKQCIALTSVSLPAAESIGKDAFVQCDALTSVAIPSATSIDDYAFEECTLLSAVDFGDTPRPSVPSLGSDAFSGVPSSCKIIVPYTQYDAWIAASGWSSLPQEFVRHAEKADKPTTFTAGNLAALDANGNPTDSGKKAGDFATAAQGTKADTAIQGVKVNGTALTPDANKAVNVQVPSAGSALPLIAGVSDAGSSANFSREDHVHPAETAVLPLGYALPASAFPVSYYGQSTSDPADIMLFEATAGSGDVPYLPPSCGEVIAMRLSWRDPTEHAAAAFNKSSGAFMGGDGALTFNGNSGVAGVSPVLTARGSTVIVRGVEVASRVANATAGNLAALDANGNPTDSLIPAANVAQKGNIPYDLVAKTIDNGAVTLDDRASNSVTVSATLSPNTLTINFPTAPTGKLRDFSMRLNIAAGVTAPEIAWPQGVTLENNGGEVPEIADGGTGGSSTILYFSETENNGTTAKFLVKGETLTAIAQA